MTDPIEEVPVYFNPQLTGQSPSSKSSVSYNTFTGVMKLGVLV